MSLINIVGIAGGLLFLFAFYRTSIGRWTGKSLWYELDNLFGAILMSWYAYQKHAYINIALNFVWGVVALRGVTALAERRIGADRQKRRAKANRRTTRR